MDKQELIKLIEEATKKYWRESPCMHCGPGNGCDDCRGCEDAHKNHELEAKIYQLKEKYKELFGEEYKSVEQKAQEEKEIKNRAIKTYYDSLGIRPIEEVIEKNIEKYGANEFYNILENSSDYNIKEYLFNCIKESVFQHVKPTTFETIKDLAKALNGNERHDEMWIGDDPHIAYEICERKGWLVIYPCSDDLLEIEGAYREEFGAYDGTIVKFVKAGDFYNLVGDCYDDEDTYKKAKENIFVDTKHELVGLYDIAIESIWEPTGSEYTWEIIVSGAPCEYFDLMNDGEKWARCAVIDMKQYYGK